MWCFEFRFNQYLVYFIADEKIAGCINFHNNKKVKFIHMLPRQDLKAFKLGT